MLKRPGSSVLSQRLEAYEVKEQHFPELTPRERMVMTFIITGFTAVEIADEMECSRRAVNSLTTRIMATLDAHRATDMVHLFYQRQKRPGRQSP